VTTVTFTLIVPPVTTPPTTNSANCTSPQGNAAAQAVNDTAAGLAAGDLVLFTLGSGTSTSTVVAEVTSVSGTTTAGSAPALTAYTVTFASSDALNMNQGTTVPNSLAYQFTNGSKTGFASRLMVITYYIDDTPIPPRLMQQISGHAPVPVAENVVYMKFSYDLYNDTVTPAVVAQGCPDPGATAAHPVEGSSSDGCGVAGASSGLLPNQITKVNILNMAMNSTLLGGQIGGSGYQRMDLQTSVCPRNLTYSNNFAGPTTQ
jgi:hypothetical protein